MEKKDLLNQIVKIKNPFALLAFLIRYCFKEILIIILIAAALVIIFMIKIMYQMCQNGQI
jgi:hypothetical protein